MKWLRCGCRGRRKMSKYNRVCKGVTIDVYDVLTAFNVTNPALQHLVKKALCAGLRGHKDKAQDMVEILESAKRAVELEGDLQEESEMDYAIEALKLQAKALGGNYKKWQVEK